LVEDVLACRDLHEEQVAHLNRMMVIDRVQSGRVRPGYVRNGIFYGLVGVIFAALGFTQLRFLGPQAVFFMVVGGLLLYAAAANFLEARRFP
jgi:small neutral amino acid transporter SnatA (MarC family)